MDDKELELFEAMGNCYQACHKGFEETLEMISGWRGYTSDEVHQILIEVKANYSKNLQYIELRKKFPEEFPI